MFSQKTILNYTSEWCGNVWIISFD